MKESFPLRIVRDALVSSDFRLLLSQDGKEHYVREGRYIVVHIAGDRATEVENAEVTRSGRRITFVFDGMPAEMFHVREDL